MKLKELIKNLEVLELHADPETEIGGVSYDSRCTKRGDAFFAVVGFESDGHRFISAAADMGATVVICQIAPENAIPYVIVKDSRLALAIASRDFYGAPAEHMKIIGVTGTNGKTTTTYLLKHMLETKLGAKVGLIGTNGNMIGQEHIHSERTTPESCELQSLFRSMLDAGCSYVVMEVSSHSLQLDRVAGVAFDIGVFTNLTQDHLDFHKTMEEYARAKARLFSMCRCGCLNMDDKWFETMKINAECDVFTFSASDKNASLRAKNIKLSASAVSFDAVAGDERAEIRLAIPGQFSVYNALGVIACGLNLGLSLYDCAEALADAKGVKGRMEVVPTDGNYTILIDYAHTPDALENALKALKSTGQGRVVALFGCGGDRDRTKRPIMGTIASENADFTIVTSDNPRTEEPDAIINDIIAGMQNSAAPYTVICDRAEAIRWAIDNHMENDVILLAGKGHEDYQVVGHEKHHMDEREIVAEHIEKRKNR
ncbi:MAG: UDP-N-acetylmuramoyl-L-alanyl-D-glutamate--2,6-diaminopimelate ligase [Oscillospiraceae bacterium]|nr:UDP-N-acetylmuramoyl-L-alanyl-D-glutamate--2,6-diaminopimelate ligase [Oscillospiraceae bacterium]